MINPFSVLPAYVLDSPKFAAFLESVNNYILSGATAVGDLKSLFLTAPESPFVVSSLAASAGVSVELPFVSGTDEVDWDTYYKQLYLAYCSRTFAAFFDGTLANFVLGDVLASTVLVDVMDFSVAEDVSVRQPMSVVYSVVSMDDNMTLDIVKNELIPPITGVNGALYYLLYGSTVFGFDRDDIVGKALVYSGGAPKLEESGGPFYVVSAVISNVGTGYSVGDTVVATVSGASVSLKISNLAVGASLVVVSPEQSYSKNPSADGVSVSGGSGTGMEVNILAAPSSSSAYFVRGYDEAYFVPTVKSGG